MKAVHHRWGGAHIPGRGWWPDGGSWFMWIHGSCVATYYHKPFNTLRSTLVHPKGKTPDHKKCGVVYEMQCPECPALYVGETARTLETRMNDHLKHSPRTAVGDHEHPIKMDDVKVRAREDNMWRLKRISLIRLVKWPWWSRKLATLQHIWLW